MFDRFTCVFGHSGTDCGPASLASVARHYGCRISISQVRNLAECDLDGVALPALAKAAAIIGFDANIGVANFDALDKMPLPAIALLDDEIPGHYVVIYRVWGDHVFIADPSLGLQRLSRSELDRRWQAKYILLLRPNALAAPEDYPNSLLELLKLLLRNHTFATLAVTLSLISTVLGILISYLLQLIIDRAIPSSNYSLLAVLAFGAVVITVAKAVSFLVRRNVVTAFGRRIESELRLGYVGALLRLPMRFISTRYVGDLFNRFNDVFLIRASIAGTTLSIALDLLFLFGCGLVMLRYSPLLTFITFICVPLISTLAWWSAAKIMSSERRYRQAESEVSSLVIDILGNIRMIKAYAAELAMCGRITAAYKKAEEIMGRCDETFAIFESLGAFATASCAVLLLWIGAHLALERQISVGRLMFFFSVSAIVLGITERILPSVPSVQKALSTFERLQEVVLAIPEQSGAGSLNYAPGKSSEINISSLNFWYRPESPVLSDVCLRVERGETLAIVGPTGCGKTTLANLLVGLETPRSGQIEIDGIELHDLDKSALRQCISIVFQESSLLNASILENITLGDKNLTGVEVVEACRYAMADEFISHLPHGYNSPVGSSGMALSSGQRQRIAIARALVRKPAILILDEATSNLDPETERGVLQAVGSQRITSIFITHRLTTARFADRIVVLDSGRIIEIGSHEELVAKQGKYCSMWRAFQGDNMAQEIAI